MTLTQINRQVAVYTPLGDDVLLLESLVGREGLSEMPQFVLELLSTDPEIDFDAIVGQNLTVSVERPGGDYRYFNGIVNTFEQIPDEGELTRYRATLVPWLWFLTRVSDCRIFQNMSVPEIVEDVFRRHGFTDFDSAMLGTYPAREYSVQYRETDFDFISRLLEEEGIYYFFRHEDGRHMLVLADSISAHELIEDETIPYSGEIEHRSQTVWNWRVQKKAQSGLYTLRDVDFQAPKKALEVKSESAGEHALSEFEVYDFPGRYTRHDVGEQYARVRVEELQARHEILSGESDVRALGTGVLFNLIDAPRFDQNREYLVTSIEYCVRSNPFRSDGPYEATYGVHFTCIDSRVPFRPARTTPRPVILGPQTGVVVGKEGEEIWTDEFGRVKVLFPWDREGRGDETSSCWIRVSQSTAGKRWGAIQIPRIGQEVIVEFLNGDPDRPIVTGTVYNGDNKPPYALPENASVSGFRSNSTKGGSGHNEIRFEDKKDEEQLFIHAQRNFDIFVKGDRHEMLEGGKNSKVSKDAKEQIDGSRHLTIGKDHLESVGADRNLSVDGKEAKSVGGSLSLQVAGNVIEDFSADHIEQCGGNYALSGSEIEIKAMSKITLSCGGSSIEITPGGVNIVTPKLSVTAAGAVDVTAGGAANVTAATTTISSAAVTISGVTTVGGPVIAPSVVSGSYTPGAGNVM